MDATSALHPTVAISVSVLDARFAKAGMVLVLVCVQLVTVFPSVCCGTLLFLVGLDRTCEYLVRTHMERNDKVIIFGDNVFSLKKVQCDKAPKGTNVRYYLY